MCPNDPDATRKLKECEKAVMKIKFEEAISVPESQRRSVADSIDYRSIGTKAITFMCFLHSFYFFLINLGCPYLCYCEGHNDIFNYLIINSPYILNCFINKKNYEFIVF